MKSIETVFADFNNADKSGRVRLNTVGTFNDLKIKEIQLHQGMQIMLDDNDEFKIIATVEFSEDENIWVANIDWKDLDR